MEKLPIKRQELSDDGDLERERSQGGPGTSFSGQAQADEGEVYLSHQKRHVPFGVARSNLAGRDKNILADSS